MPFTTYTTGKKITSIKGSYGCPRWFDAVYSGDMEYIRKHAKNIGKVSVEGRKKSDGRECHICYLT